jgi:hypothetical protein
MTTPLLHLGLLVRDQQRSLRFYATYFGFDAAGAVRTLLARLDNDGVPIPERWEEPGYVAFKCLDPDGWRVEAYWEPVT